MIVSVIRYAIIISIMTSGAIIQRVVQLQKQKQLDKAVLNELEDLAWESVRGIWRRHTAPDALIYQRQVRREAEQKRTI